MHNLNHILCMHREPIKKKNINKKKILIKTVLSENADVVNIMIGSK